MLSPFPIPHGALANFWGPAPASDTPGRVGLPPRATSLAQDTCSPVGGAAAIPVLLSPVMTVFKLRTGFL